MGNAQPLVLTSRILFFSALAGIAGLFILILLIPSWRQGARDWLETRSRKVLSQAQGDLTGKGDAVTVLKVRTLDAVILEVFENDAEGRPVKFRTRVVLPESRDGHIQFQGQSTNLVMTDLDGDGGMEIVAPTYDDGLMPRLHVYKYDQRTQRLYRMAPGSFEL